MGNSWATKTTTVPSGLTATAISGAGWSCTPPHRAHHEREGEHEASDQYAATPPLAWMVWPVMKPLSSLTRNRHVAAISSGVP